MARFFDFTKIAMWLGLVIALNMVVILVNQGAKNYELQRRTDKLETEIAQLENDKQQLGYKILYYKTDSHKEKLAREKLGLKMPGESVVIVPSSNDSANKAEPTATPNNKSTAVTPSNFEQWFDFLFGS